MARVDGVSGDKNQERLAKTDHIKRENYGQSNKNRDLTHLGCITETQQRRRKVLHLKTWKSKGTQMEIKFRHFTRIGRNKDFIRLE